MENYVDEIIYERLELIKNAWEGYKDGKVELEIVIKEIEELRKFVYYFGGMAVE